MSELTERDFLVEIVVNNDTREITRLYSDGSRMTFCFNTLLNCIKAYDNSFYVKNRITAAIRFLRNGRERDAQEILMGILTDYFYFEETK